MVTLVAIVASLTGGLSAVLGTVVWLGLLLVRRIRGVPATLELEDLWRVWGISAFVGIPIVFPWMPDFILESGKALMPVLYDACIVLLAANVSVAIGTVLCLAVMGVARLLGLLARQDGELIAVRWPMTVVWGASAAIGVPLLASRTSALMQALAVRGLTGALGQ